MRTYDTRAALRVWRGWRGSADELAALASVFVWGLELEPDPSTTAGDVITRRTIRYYTTRGVLSPPEGQTRSATYHYRHLLELLLIKLGQNRGLTIERIKSWGDTETVDSLEAQVLERAVGQTTRPLPSDPELFESEEPSTVLNYWRRTMPYAQRDYVQEQSVSSATRSLSLPNDRRYSVPAQDSGDQQDTDAPGAVREAADMPYRTDVLHRDGAKTFVHVHVAPDIELVIATSHGLARDPGLRSRFISEIRRWINANE